MAKKLILGTRQSPLAMVQANYVRDLLCEAWPDLTVEIKTFKTSGDKFLEKALSAVGDKGLFVKELEEALLKNEVDLCIHSMKDMLSVLPEGFDVTSITKREDPRDAFVSLKYADFWELPLGAVVGTASVRRTAQIKQMRPDLDIQVVRGNLQTRYRKLKEGHYDALILASAGLTRMGWADKIRHCFNPYYEMLPAGCQGVLAAEYRTGDEAVERLISPLIDPETQTVIEAERAFLKTLEGGCSVPVGVYARRESLSNQVQIKAAVYSLDGEEVLECEDAYNPEEATLVGRAMANKLLIRGAAGLLA